MYHMVMDVDRITILIDNDSYLKVWGFAALDSGMLNWWWHLSIIF